MEDQHVPLNRVTLTRFTRSIRNFATGEAGPQAIFLFALLLTLLVAINGLNVVSSYVGRDFMTAIAERNRAGFVLFAFVYVLVFAASTVAAVSYRFVEERLGLLWRRWQTQRLTTTYLARRTYYRLDAGGLIANADQRITDDVRAFTTTTLSFVLMMLNATFTVVAFSGVLWTISPSLFAVAVGYAAVGSLAAIYLGRPLVGLNYTQLDKEANFRAELIHVRENAESVALAHREGRLRVRLAHGLDELTNNYRRIIAVNRNLSFFTTGYNYLIQIIPALIVAPLYIREEVEFGVITQSAMAFAQLLGAFSLIVTQFQSISSFAAVLARLNALNDAFQQAHAPTPAGIEVREESGRLAYEHLTLHSPRDGRVLVADLSITIARGTRLLVLGSDDTAKVALFRATASMWDAGVGRIIRPGLEDILFLPERPYMPPGTLREGLVRTRHDADVSDERIVNTLHELGLDAVLKRAGGLDVEKDWDDILSLGEQQQLAFARLILAAPTCAFLHRISTALNAAQICPMLRIVARHGITYVTFGTAEDDPSCYDVVLQLGPGGSWEWKPLEASPAAAEPGAAAR